MLVGMNVCVCLFIIVVITIIITPLMMCLNDVVLEELFM